MYGLRGHKQPFRGGRGVGPMPGTGTFGNRYNTLNSESEGDAWQDVNNRKGKNKRLRRSTGGTSDQYRGPEADYSGQTVYPKMSKNEFRGLSTDEKLVTMFEALTEIGSLSGRMQNVECSVEILETINMAHNERITLLEYKSIDMEARSRRNNLIFRGHPETVGNDDCNQIVRRFLAEWLELNPDMCIQRAHRLGNVTRTRRGRGGRTSVQPRPIIVNFRDYEDVEIILENAKKLKGTNFGINRDYPKEIVSARSKLWPEYKKAREENSKGEVYIGYPAKLIVNKKVVRDEFPDWRKVLSGSRLQENEGPNKHVDSNTGNKQHQSYEDPPTDTNADRQGDDKQGDDSADDAVSMTSERSRSRSRSGSGHRSSSSGRLGRYINEELIQRAQNANNAAESSSKGPTKQIPENGDKQSDNTYLSTYDIEMKKLEHHNERLTQQDNTPKADTDTGQNSEQSQNH